MALHLTDANFEEYLNGELPLVVDFWAEWCGPCRAIGPVVEELATEYDGRVVVAKIDVDENDDVVSRFGVRNIPTLLFFKGGQLVDKLVGGVPKAQIQTRIESLL